MAGSRRWPMPRGREASFSENLVLQEDSTPERTEPDHPTFTSHDEP